MPKSNARIESFVEKKRGPSAEDLSCGGRKVSWFQNKGEISEGVVQHLLSRPSTYDVAAERGTEGL